MSVFMSSGRVWGSWQWCWLVQAGSGAGWYRLVVGLVGTGW